MKADVVKDGFTDTENPIFLLYSPCQCIQIWSFSLSLFFFVFDIQGSVLLASIAQWIAK